MGSEQLQELKQAADAFLQGEAAFTGIPEEGISVFAIALLSLIRQDTTNGLALLITAERGADAETLSFDIRQVQRVERGKSSGELVLRAATEVTPFGWPPQGWTESQAPTLRVVRDDRDD